MSLWLACDPIAFMQPRVEPLRRVGHTGLVKDTIDELFVKDLRILFRSKIAVTFAPHPPAVSHAVCDLFDGGLASQGAIRLGNACLTKIFLGKNVGCNLTPSGGDLYIGHLKHYFSTGITDNGSTIIIGELIEYVSVFLSEAADKLQAFHRLLSRWHKSVTFIENFFE